MKYFSIAFFVFLSSCTYLSVEELTVDCNQNPIKGEAVILNADCGLANGTITIEATGGKAPYDYQNGDVRQLEPVFEGLLAGGYTIIITDANGCTSSLEATVLNKDGVQATVSVTAEAGCSVSQGEITVNATNGETPYKYSINGGVTQSSNVFDKLDYGVYTILVKDNIGCEFTLEEQLFSGVSYAQSIEPLMMNSCSVTGCHNGSQFPDLRTYEGVKNSSARVKEFTQSGFMPISGTLTQEQKDAIACWIDDGALNN